MSFFLVGLLLRGENLPHVFGQLIKLNQHSPLAAVVLLLMQNTVYSHGGVVHSESQNVKIMK